MPRAWFFPLLLSGLVVSLAACGSSSSGGGGSGAGGGSESTTEPADMNGMVEAHNAARDDVMPAAKTPIPHLTWDSKIAEVAQAYAEKCVFQHSMNPLYGENLYVSEGLPTKPKDVVDAWVSEVKDYDYATATCNAGAECGHYTQVVWADSLRVGCGEVDCTENSPFGDGQTWQNWVCNYDPPGNYIGEQPY